MCNLLIEAEKLEAQAAVERVGYFDLLLKTDGQGQKRLLDVGCGNGYSVREWRAKGFSAFGVDISSYRLSRWVAEHPDRRPLVLADAAHLPFRDDTFDTVVSSGMIEHVGVSESSGPYTIVPHPDRSQKRQQVVADVVRVAKPSAEVILDFPNGTFPIDFWHGDHIGAFRLHPVPDTLLPSYGDLRRWARRCGVKAVLKPTTGRLRFRQVGRHWWGRLFTPMMRATLRCLDLLSSLGLARLAAPFYPYLVVQLVSPGRKAA